MNRREMLATTGAATLGALVMPKLMKAEAPASQVAIVRCRDYAQYATATLERVRSDRRPR